MNKEEIIKNLNNCNNIDDATFEEEICLHYFDGTIDIINFFYRALKEGYFDMVNIGLYLIK